MQRSNADREAELEQGISNAANELASMRHERDAEAQLKQALQQGEDALKGIIHSLSEERTVSLKEVARLQQKAEAAEVRLLLTLLGTGGTCLA